MDASNIAHFAFSLSVPIGWVMILRPFSRALFKSWRQFLFWILLLSLVAICGKELFDDKASVNDIVSDVLGFFLGVALISGHFHQRKKKLTQAEEREVSGQKISLRGTLALIEKIEKRSSEFYRMAATKSSHARTSGICLLLARDAEKRAKSVGYTLHSWRSQPDSEELSLAVEKAFSSQEFFSLVLPPAGMPREILQIALDHEKKKLSLFSKMERAFHEEWKVMHMEAVRDKLSKAIGKLELCLAELEKESRTSA